MAFSYGWRGPNIVKDGLVLYLDPGSPNSYFNKSSTTIQDISGNGYNSTLVNGPVYETSGSGSIRLDGTNDTISIPSHPTASGLTLSFWLNITSSYSNIQTIIGDGAQSNTVGYIWIYRGSTNGLQYQFATSTVRSLLNDTNIFSDSLNTWANYVFTADYTSHPSGSLSIYKNGIISSTATYPSINIPLSRTRYIGTYDGANFALPGNVGHYLEYNRALSATEITQNYNATKTRFGL
jgi:hypothetical protein